MAFSGVIGIGMHKYTGNKVTLEKNKAGIRIKNKKHVELKNNEKIEPEQVSVPIDNTMEVPVLMYHSIGYEKSNDLVIKPEALEAQLKFLKENNYTTLNLEELYQYFSAKKSLPEKPVVLTFDDGYENNYSLGYPLFKKYGIKANIFVITSWVDTSKNFLTSSQIKELDVNGIEIESHTFNHDELSKLSYEKQVDTLKKSKEYLEKTLNRPVYYLAYPFGHYNEESTRALKDAGYRMGVLTRHGMSKASQGLFTLSRMRINADDSIQVFRSKINGRKRKK